MSKLYIVMPVINCLELTQSAIDSIKTNCSKQIILIDNASTDGTQEWALKSGLIDNYIRNDQRKSVSQSWNQGVELALKDQDCQYIAILNNDIVLHQKTLNHMMAFMDQTKYLMVTADNVKDRMSVEVMKQMELPQEYTDFDTWPIEGWRAEGPDFSCYMISRDTIEVIGWFDENYEGAYCEDQDFHIRFERARRWVKEYNDQGIALDRIHAKRLSTAPYFHYASQTIARNQNLRADISSYHGRNQSYYLRKWGAEHPQAMDGGGFITPFGDARYNWRWWEGVEKYGYK